jgi:hypothetical protein
MSWLRLRITPLWSPDWRKPSSGKLSSRKDHGESPQYRPFACPWHLRGSRKPVCVGMLFAPAGWWGYHANIAASIVLPAFVLSALLVRAARLRIAQDRAVVNSCPRRNANPPLTLRLTSL